MSKLKILQPITIGGLELKNRAVMAPMCTYEARNRDGRITDFHKVHYGARALGGIALINIEATGVEPDGRISPYDLGLWNDEQGQGLKELVALLHQFGAKVSIQLGHAGRKAKGASEVIAPSPIAFNDEYETPKEMDIHRIHDVVEKFKKSAEYAAAAGVDMIQLHAAHGYLLNQFISPLSNRRSDEYGGTTENRYRILREVIDSVKAVYQGHIWVRISADEYSEDGTKLEEFIQMARWMKEQGVLMVDVSSGGVIDYYPDRIYAGYQIPLAAAIKNGADIPVAAVGLLNDPKLAEFALQSGQTDLICLGRPLLNNPNWLQMAADSLGAKEEFKAYNNSYERGRTV